MRVAFLVAALVAASLRPAAAQRFWSVDFARAVDASARVHHNCLQRAYVNGVGASAGRHLKHPALSISANVRAYSFPMSAYCDNGLHPADGTYDEDDLDPLLTTEFAATEIRGRVRVGSVPRGWTFGIGGGVAWRRGDDVPFALVSAHAPVVIPRGVTIALLGEYRLLHVSWNRFRRTYQTGQVVATQPLGRAHEWASAVWIGMSIEVTPSLLPQPAPMRRFSTSR